MSLAELVAFFPPGLAGMIVEEQNRLTELRLRAGRPMQLVCAEEDRFVGDPIPPQQLRRIALALMEHSDYAREEELSQGFFTMRNGFRVGVCGSFSRRDGGAGSIRAIGSLCIRIARAVPGCAKEVLEAVCGDGVLRSALILSSPGLGKTTILRDAARLLSESGYTVGIADERHELAACRDGVPTLDVGPRTDVVDGCPKAQGMEQLIRSMAPDVIVTDEIGNALDATAVREAARRGVALLTSAHASGIETFAASGLGRLVRDGLFSRIVLLKGRPGQIERIVNWEEERGTCS